MPVSASAKPLIVVADERSIRLIGLWIVGEERKEHLERQLILSFNSISLSRIYLDSCAEITVVELITLM